MPDLRTMPSERVSDGISPQKSGGFCKSFSALHSARRQPENVAAPKHCHCRAGGNLVSDSVSYCLLNNGAVLDKQSC